MKEHPIIFNGEMVRAIQDGRKTMTRRPVKHIPLLGGPLAWCAAAKAQEPEWVSIVGDYRRFSPFGTPGDHLWVRETWANATDFGYAAGHVFYRASYVNGGPYDDVKRWHPSIHMPRWASRIILEVLSVRVERVQEITEEDCLREGIEDMGNGCGAIALKGHKTYSTLRACFQIIWDSIYGPGSWDRNEWVWVGEFRRIEP